MALILTTDTFARALPMTYDNIIRPQAGKYGIDPLLMHALIQQESGHNPGICSRVGACGLMQLMPGTASDLGVRNRADPVQNVAGGTRYFKQMLGMFNNNVVNSLRAYNWGPGNMRSYLRGVKRVMPAETRQYSASIKNFYYGYGGRANHFVDGANAKNINNKATTTSLDASATCKAVKLPPSANVDFGSIPALPPINPQGSGDRTIFDPTKTQITAQNIVEIYKQMEIMRGQYDSMTKGLAGLDLLTNISQLAGYEFPKALPSGFDVPQEFGSGGNNVYKSLTEQRASNTGVFSSPELSAAHNQNAQISNHAYAEAEMSWTQINCSLNTIGSLATANASTQTLKQSKDLGNRIALEKAMLEASTAKIRSSLVMMQGARSNYQLAMQQAMNKYKTR